MCVHPGLDNISILTKMGTWLTCSCSVYCRIWYLREQYLFETESMFNFLFDLDCQSLCEVFPNFKFAPEVPDLPCLPRSERRRAVVLSAAVPFSSGLKPRRRKERLHQVVQLPLTLGLHDGAPIYLSIHPSIYLSYPILAYLSLSILSIPVSCLSFHRSIYPSTYLSNRL